MSSLKLFVLIVCSAFLLVLGCDSITQTDDTTNNLEEETEEGTGEETGGKTGSQTGGYADQNDSDPGAAFVGTWGELLNLPVKQVGIPGSPPVVAVGRTYYLNTIHSDGEGNLTIEHKACRIVIKVDSIFGKMSVPNKFVDGLEPLVRQVSLSSNQPGTPFVSDDVYEVRGARLEDPETDPLPAHGSGGKALSCGQAPMGSECDQDNDGNPGMTNVLTGALGCKIYVAQKWNALYEGTIVDADTIAGPVTKTFSWQSLLGSDRTICESAKVENTSVIENCPAYYYFHMVRLPQNATCEDVMALTTCDENPEDCDQDATYPLNPKKETLKTCYSKAK